MTNHNAAVTTAFVGGCSGCLILCNVHIYMHAVGTSIRMHTPTSSSELLDFKDQKCVPLASNTKLSPKGFPLEGVK